MCAMSNECAGQASGTVKAGHPRTWSGPSPSRALAAPRLSYRFPVRVLVDQVVTVNRGVRAAWPLQTGSTGTFPR